MGRSGRILSATFTLSEDGWSWEGREGDDDGADYVRGVNGCDYFLCMLENKMVLNTALDIIIKFKINVIDC